MPASVKGAIELRKALRTFTPDLAKETQKEITGALKPIVKSARGYLPDSGEVLSGWLPRQSSKGTFPTYEARLVKTGVTYKTSPSKANSKGFRSLASLFNKTPAGSIYEVMGKVNPDSTFVKNQTGKYKSSMKGSGQMEGRALYRAYEENNGKARAAVLAALTTAANKLNARATVRG
jgi:hypothetical protein